MTDSQLPRPEITEGDRVEARGIPITLIDGRIVRLRFGAKALRFLEQQYGSLASFQAEAMKGAEGRAVTATFDALIAGLTHERLGTPEEVEDLLDEDRLTTEYADAFNRAWGEALPPEGSSPARPIISTTDATTPGLFHGETSSTTSPLSSAGQRISSGT